MYAEESAQMIKIASKPARINAEFITGPGLQLLGFRDTADPMPAFGLDVGPNMAVVPGRILSRPLIKYANNQESALVPTEHASWNMRGATFHTGAKLERWAVMVIKDGNHKEFQGVNDPELLTVIRGFSQMCATSGMLVDRTPPPRFFANLPKKNQQQPTRHDAIEAIRSAIFGLKEKQVPKPKIMLARCGFSFRSHILTRCVV
jgi:eukaryotic translation initiation factor 2C